MAALDHGTCQPPGGRLITVDLSVMEGAEIHLHWDEDECSECGFAFPAHHPSSSIITQALRSALSSITASLAAARLLIRDFLSQRGKHSHWLMSRALKDLTTYSEVAGLIEEWNDY